VLPLAAVLLGALGGVGLFTVIVGLRKRPKRERRAQLRDFRARATRIEMSSSTNDTLVMIALGPVLGFGAWYATGGLWPG